MSQYADHASYFGSIPMDIVRMIDLYNKEYLKPFDRIIDVCSLLEYKAKVKEEIIKHPTHHVSRIRLIGVTDQYVFINISCFADKNTMRIAKLDHQANLLAEITLDQHITIFTVLQNNQIHVMNDVHNVFDDNLVLLYTEPAWVDYMNCYGYTVTDKYNVYITDFQGDDDIVRFTLTPRQSNRLLHGATNSANACGLGRIDDTCTQERYSWQYGTNINDYMVTKTNQSSDIYYAYILDDLIITKHDILTGEVLHKYELCLPNKYIKSFESRTFETVEGNIGFIQMIAADDNDTMLLLVNLGVPIKQSIVYRIDKDSNVINSVYINSDIMFMCVANNKYYDLTGGHLAELCS